ncbi:MAG: FAD-dependent oxidoreductase, partial [Gemmatimonadota bacterium]|nr:FAD-dependent oxidoreductase [Gemmatimonadota bacterium]
SAPRPTRGNAPGEECGVSARGHRLDATWAIATAAKASYPAWLDTTVVWEASEPYLYLRTTADRRLVAGGEDEARELRHRDRRLLGRKARAINQKLGTLIPDLHYRIQYRWAGTFGGSDTGLPMIGAVPGMAGCYAVMGFGGNGIVNASIASELIVAALEGRRDPDARLYRLSS